MTQVKQIVISPLHNMTLATCNQAPLLKDIGVLFCLLESLYIQGLISPMYSHGHTYVDQDPQGYMALHLCVCVCAHVYIQVHATSYPMASNATNLQLQTLTPKKFLINLQGRFFQYKILMLELVLIKDKTHVDVIGINLLEVLRPYQLRHPNNIGLYNTSILYNTTVFLRHCDS